MFWNFVKHFENFNENLEIKLKIFKIFEKFIIFKVKF